MRPRTFSPYQAFLGEVSCVQHNLVLLTPRQPWMGYPTEIQENVIKLPLHSQKYPQSYPGLCPIHGEGSRREDGVLELEFPEYRNRRSTVEASSPHRAYCVELGPRRQVTSSLSPEIRTPSSERLDHLPKVTHLVNGGIRQPWYSVNIHCVIPIVSILLPQNLSEIRCPKFPLAHDKMRKTLCSFKNEMYSI